MVRMDGLSMASESKRKSRRVCKGPCNAVLARMNGMAQVMNGKLINDGNRKGLLVLVRMRGGLSTQADRRKFQKGAFGSCNAKVACVVRRHVPLLYRVLSSLVWISGTWTPREGAACPASGVLRRASSWAAQGGSWGTRSR